MGGSQEAPGSSPLGALELEMAIAREARPLEPNGEQPGEVAHFRAGLHAWLIAEARWYHADGNPAEVRGLLADAARVRMALEKAENAALPQRGGQIYAASFRELPQDWSIFGFGTIKADLGEGLYIAPNTTMNLWSHREFSGDYLVEFAYRPEPVERRPAGTFLQINGQTVLQRDPVDFMTSATGRMPDYNFGMKCYHFSFNRQARERQRTNFRKTGEAFRLLSLAERATASDPQWHTISVARRGSQFLLYINGEFVLESFDEGHRGPRYERGRLGLRNWGGMKAWFRDLKVYELKP